MPVYLYLMGPDSAGINGQALDAHEVRAAQSFTALRCRPLRTLAALAPEAGPLLRPASSPDPMSARRLVALAALAGIPRRSATGVPRSLSLPRGLRSLLSSRAARGLSATGMSASWAGRSTRDRRSPSPKWFGHLALHAVDLLLRLAFMLAARRPALGQPLLAENVHLGCDISRQRPIGRSDVMKTGPKRTRFSRLTTSPWDSQSRRTSRLRPSMTTQ